MCSHAKRIKVKEHGSERIASDEISRPCSANSTTDWTGSRKMAPCCRRKWVAWITSTRCRHAPMIARTVSLWHEPSRTQERKNEKRNALSGADKSLIMNNNINYINYDISNLHLITYSFIYFTNIPHKFHYVLLFLIESQVGLIKR